jgi:TPR repeat protein
MGIAFIYGELKLQRSTRAAQFYLRRSATYANRESPQGAYTWALILLGLYEEDLGFRDPIEAKEVLEKCAELDYEPAQYQLGYNYEFGEHGCPVDPATSIGFYRRAAIRGYAKAQMSMSSWYLTGAPLVLMQSDDLAYKWCQKAAEQGLPKAMYAMGYYNELGVGVEPDEDAAMTWYSKALAQGSEEAGQRLEMLKEERRKRMGGSLKKDPEVIKKKKKKAGCIIC